VTPGIVANSPVYALEVHASAVTAAIGNESADFHTLVPHQHRTDDVRQRSVCVKIKVRA